MYKFISAAPKCLIFGLMMVFLAVGICGCGSQSADTIVDNQQTPEPVTLLLSAAASLTDVMADLEKVYQEEHPHVSFELNLGSSGSLQQQIEQGAPADVFISAAKDKMDGLEEKDLIVKETRKDIVKNTMVLVVAQDNEDIKSFEDLEKAGVIAIGEPDSVPAGKYAVQTLTSLNLLDRLSSKMVYGKDVRQVLAYVESGDVDAGLVYQTDAKISEQVKVVDVADESLHSPLLYPAAVIKSSRNQEEAQAFVDFLSTDPASAVFEKYGFTIVE
ncbi:MAG: molybdate ABC transporter substrate-binding protein [Syntrophomonadaceae bacterium]|jgi:molybdate transport system substrate-binding protein|nr:molybdate ABC transporter substrate-binding protein [Syntrophomonadaceae bacterium]